MMKTKQLKSIRKVIIIFLIFVTTGCKSQNTSFVISDIKPTHKVDNEYLDNIFKEILNNDAFENWKMHSDKVVLVSSKNIKGDTLVRSIPVYINMLDKLNLPNNYTAYFMYEDIFVIYWGDERMFLAPLKIKILQNIFNYQKSTDYQKDEYGNDIVVIRNKAYYGADFIIKDGELTLKEISYFASPLL